MHDDLDIPLPAMSPGGTSAASYRVPRPRETIDPNTKRLAMIAGGIVGVFVVLAGAYSYIGHRRAGVPVVEADARPLRVKPADAGGMQVAGADEAILSGQADGKVALSPPTEAPAPQALKLAAPAEAPAVAAAPQPAAQMPAAMAAAPVAMIAPATAEKSAAVAPRVAPPAPVAPVAAKPAKPLTVAALDKPAAATPPHTASVIQTPPPAPLAASASHPATHGAMVQLAAVGSEQAAQSEWQRLSKKMPDLLGSRTPSISKVTHDGKTFWRLRTGGFADQAAAKGLCDQLKARSAGCAVSSS